MLLTETLDPSDLAAASVCAGWTVDEIVRHVISGCRMSVLLASGSSATEAVEVREQPINGPLVQELGDAISQQQAALQAHRPDDFIVHHPIVDMTMKQLIEVRLVEFIVHGSDLARSVGRADEIDAALAEAGMAAMAPLAGITAALGEFGSGPSGQVGADAQSKSDTARRHRKI